MRKPLFALLLSFVAFLLVTFVVTLWRSPHSLTVLIASAYEEGLVVSRNPGKAIDWYLGAAEKGDPVAQYKLGIIQYYGRGIDADRLKGLRWINESADHGNVDAQYYMGVASIVGLDVPSDFGQAAQWFSKAAEQGHAKAQRQLGLLYYKGNGVKANDQEAFRWANKAGAQGDAEALTLLATLNFAGKGIPANPENAVKLLTQAAMLATALHSKCWERPLCMARVPLKTYLPHCIGIPVLPIGAGSTPNAQYVLGYVYSNGIDIPVNYALANHWLLQAAIQGNAVAQITLAFHLDKGHGIQRNKLKACGLLRVALKQTLPNDIAGPMRVELEEEEKTLSPQQLAEIRALEKLYSSPAGLRELQVDLTSEH